MSAHKAALRVRRRKHAVVRLLAAAAAGEVRVRLDREVSATGGRNRVCLAHDRNLRVHKHVLWSVLLRDLVLEGLDHAMR